MEQLSHPKKGFSTFQKFAIILVLLGVTAFVIDKFAIHASTKLNLSLMSQESINNGLVGYWSFDGNTIDFSKPVAEVKDMSGNGITGDWQNHASTTIDGRIGQAVQFDGSDDIIDLGDTLELPLPISVSLWARPDGYPTAGAVLFTNDKSTVHSGISLEMVASGGINVVIGRATSCAAASRSSATTNAYLATSTWTHVVAIFRGPGDMSVYLNGVDQGALSYSGTNVTGVGYILGSDGSIGNSPGACAPGHFQGALDDVRMYNRELTTDDINRLYQLGGTTKINNTLRSQPSTEGSLVGHWTFDGKDMPNGLAKDSSGQGNNGSMQNMSTSTAYVTGRMGQALHFDGADDLVNLSVSSALDLNSNYTLSAWVNPDTITGGTTKATIIKRGSNASNNDPLAQYWLRMNQAGGALAFVTADGTTAQTDTFDSIPARAWSFILCTHDGSTKTCYINGVMTGSPVAVTVGAYTGAETVEAIGCTNTGCSSGQFQGSIDDVRIYNRVLSLAEIQRLYQLGGTTKINMTTRGQNAPEDGLTGHWTFDGKDVPNGLVNDTSGNGLSGSMRNMPTSTAYVSGRLGQALNFDGIDDEVSLGANTNLFRNQSAVSVAGWYYPTADTEGPPVSISIGPGNNIRFNAGVNPGGDTLFCAARAGDGEGAQTKTAAVTVNTYEWVHLTCVIDYANDTITVYRNGVEVPSTGTIAFTATQTSNTSPANARIGMSANQSNPFAGRVDDVRTYNRLLSADDVKRIYELGR